MFGYISAENNITQHCKYHIDITFLREQHTVTLTEHYLYPVTLAT